MDVRRNGQGVLTGGIDMAIILTVTTSIQEIRKKLAGAGVRGKTSDMVAMITKSREFRTELATELAAWWTYPTLDPAYRLRQILKILEARSGELSKFGLKLEEV